MFFKKQLENLKSSGEIIVPNTLKNNSENFHKNKLYLTKCTARTTLNVSYLASVKENRVLSHFQFAQRFYVNTIYREQFYESMWRRLEKHLFS